MMIPHAAEETVPEEVIEPRVLTKEEIQAQLMDHFAYLVTYWDKTSASSTGKMVGLVHYMMKTFGGFGVDLPSFDMVTAPHEDDVKEERNQGKNWMPNGLDINDGNLDIRWIEACRRAGLKMFDD